MTETIPPHWHYATALKGGYSPGTDDPYPSVTDVFELAEELAEELAKAEEFLLEGMGVCAEYGDAQGLLKEYKRHVVVDNARIHLASVERQRKLAFWADKQAQLAGSVLLYLEANFPLAISHNSLLEAWRCEADQKCEHWREEE